MPFSLSGYLLEKPRVGSANSPYTSSPDDLVSDSGAFNSAFSSNDEIHPGRTEYLVVVLQGGNLPAVLFGWTKNETGNQRFDYDGTVGNFKPLPGGPRTVVGVLGTDSNTTRLKVTPPVGSAPYRIALGFIGSGITFATSTVLTDASFGSPASGSVEISLSTGNLNWNTGDLTTYGGQTVLFQQQAPFTLKESTGRIGVLGTDTITLSPIPESGQYPLVKFGFGGYLTPIAQPDEAHLTDPPSGSFEWALTTGLVRFSSIDQVTFNGIPVYYDGILSGAPRGLTTWDSGSGTGDFLIENGVAIRFFRSPVNGDGSNPVVSDVTSVYPITDAVLASPIVGAPMVFLPVLPVDDIGHPMTFRVQQGTGTFIGPLPRLDVASPPSGVGYTLDFDQKQFFFAARVNSQVTSISAQTGALALDPFIDSSNASFLLNGNPLVIGKDIFLDSNAGVVSFISQYGTVVTSGSSGYSLNPLVFSDASGDFSSVVVGDFLAIATGANKGVYTVTGIINATNITVDAQITGSPTRIAYQIRRGVEVLADRYFQLVQFVDPHVVVNLIRNSVTTPLVQGQDYLVSKDLGTFQTKFRLLNGDQISLVYPSSQDNPDPTVLNPVLTSERGTFLHRKELTVHNTTTSVIPFNPTGLTVASNPAPTVYRGGRPQDQTQVKVDAASSTITFLPDVLPTPSGFSKITDALPHGPVVNPNENVYIDYYTYEALGGENTVVILRPDLILTPIQVNQGTSFFTVRGNRTAEFPVNYLIRIETEAAYYLAAPSYDTLTDTTTVNLLSPQVFSDSATNPNTYISSGPVNTPPTQPPYFKFDPAVFNNISRGMNQITIPGSDLSGVYVAGISLDFSVGIYNDFYLVSGSSYNATTNATVVTLTAPTLRQYLYSNTTLYRSVRPIYESTTVNLQTSGAPAVPVATPPVSLLATVLLFRKVSGQVGQILDSPSDFKIDDTGKIILAVALQPNEAISLFYTKHRIIQPGTLSSSYTHTIVPTKENGLLNQILTYSAFTYIPDSFYVRVETMGNFRGQMAADFQAQAQAAAPSSGPRVSNTSQPQLFEQGNKSLFFDEGEFANEDIVARSTLKFYNDTINCLEDVLKQMDGRVVGDYDGRFKFDGSTGNSAPSISAANNQIDDIISLAFGDVIRAYESGTQGRFYPTASSVSQVILQGVNTGDPIMNLGIKPITGSSSTFFRRFQRALITRDAKAGDTTLHVDNTAEVSSPPTRPAFTTGLLVNIANYYASYVTDAAPVTITSVSPTSLGVSALPVDVPAGATVYLSVQDTAYPPKSYRVGIDVTLDTTNGYLLYVQPIPVIGQAPVGGDILQGTAFYGNTLTSPKKIPALYGQTLTDSGDQLYPLINPSPICESNPVGANLLALELSYVQSGGILTPPNIEDPFIGVGSLFSNLFVVLNTGNFPSPAPQPGDLVRILTGNVPVVDASYHVIRFATSNYVIVETPFPINDSGFSFEITVSNNIGSIAAASTSGITLTDGSATFISSGVKPGYTVVATQLGPSYQRRQVVSVDSETQLTLDLAFSPGLSSSGYRICNPLNTFSDLSGVVNAVSSLWGVVGFEVTRIQDYFTSVSTDRLSPATTNGTVAGSIITDNSVDFIASGVQVGDYVVSSGFFKITQVIDSHNIIVDSAPPSGAITFRVVSVFGASEATLQVLYLILQQCISFRDSFGPWYDQLTINIPVVPDTHATAYGLDPTTIAGRVTLDTVRHTQVAGSISFLQLVLVSIDKLYDSRYVWIDERINFQTGLLVQQQRAVANRIKAQQDALNAMIKLLAVQ